MRPVRLALALLVAAALAPGTFVHSPPKPKVRNPTVAIAPLTIEQGRFGPLVLDGGWTLHGFRNMFGGYSALVSLPDDRLIAASDTGRRLIFTRPDRRGPSPDLLWLGTASDTDKILADLESLTRDPESGTFWGAYEGTNSIRRFGPELDVQGTVEPALIANWGDNTGAEAFVRLSDGRFLAIEEDPESWGDEIHRAVVFEDDPVDGASGAPLRVIVPDGYSPVDMAVLDENRILMLLRRLVFAIPPAFDTAFAILDTDEIAPGNTVELRLIAETGDEIPKENYEGLAVTEDAESRNVWIISDDNMMRYQRTLLLRFRWDEPERFPQQKARK
ncbi:esterase-like activity of phytase family protein [Qipengyuania sp. 902]|uniref:esterase-like activity of phytase family protein n=1 Tax=Qipengyuania sp. 902 TaxID=3417565 RepID=UPI003EB9CE33